MEIYIDGIRADIKDTSFKFMYNSPVFQDYGAEGAMDITLPASEVNKKIFGFPHRTDTGSGAGRKYAVTVKAGGVEKNGTGKLTGMSNTEYKISVGFENSDFFSQIKDKTLKDLPWETVYRNGSGESYTGALQQAEEKDYNLYAVSQKQTKENFLHNIQGLKLYNDNILPFVVDVPNGYGIIFEYSVEWTHGESIFLSCKEVEVENGRMVFKREITVPMQNGDNIARVDSRQIPQGSKGYTSFYVYMCGVTQRQDINTHYRLKYTLNNLQITLVPPDSELSEPAPYAAGGTFALPTFYAKSFMDDYDGENNTATNFQRVPKVNVFADATHNHPGTVTLSVNDSANPRNAANIVRNNIFCPMPYVAHVFDLIAMFTGYTFNKTFSDIHADLQDLVIYNNYVENSTKKNSIGGQNQLFNPTAKWDMSNHVSAMEIIKFLNVLQLFGAKLFADNNKKTLSIKTVSSILREVPGFEGEFPVNDFSAEPAFDNVDFKFNCDESLAGDMCVDLSDTKQTPYIGEKETLPASAKYKEIVCRKNNAMRQYYLYTEGTDEEDNNTDGWQLAGIVQNPYNKNPEADKVYSVESPLGPVFCAMPLQLYETDPLYADENRFKKLVYNQPDNSYFWNKVFLFMEYEAGDRGDLYTMVHDSAIIANSIKSMEEEPVMGLSFARKKYSNDPDNKTLLRHESGVNKLALRWEGENGLYETFWKEAARWLTAPTTKKVKFTIAAMSAVDFDKMKCASKVRINRQNYIIDTLQAEMGDTGAEYTGGSVYLFLKLHGPEVRL